MTIPEKSTPRWNRPEYFSGSTWEITELKDEMKFNVMLTFAVVSRDNFDDIYLYGIIRRASRIIREIQKMKGVLFPWRDWQLSDHAPTRGPTIMASKGPQASTHPTVSLCKSELIRLGTMNVKAAHETKSRPAGSKLTLTSSHKVSFIASVAHIQGDYRRFNSIRSRTRRINQTMPCHLLLKIDWNPGSSVSIRFFKLQISYISR